VLACALALASKETAVVVPLALTAWALAERRGGARLATVAPAWALAGTYLVLRAHFLGPASELAGAPDPLRVFVGIGVYGWGLLPLRLTTGVHHVSLAEAAATRALAMAALAWLLLIVGLIAAVRRRAASAVGLLSLAVLSLLPVLVGPTPHVPGVTGKYALSDRWLATAAAAAAVGGALAAGRLSVRMQRLVGGALALWIAASLAVAPAAHAFYASDEALLELEELQFQDTPVAFRTVEDRCRSRDRQLARAVVKRDADEAERAAGLAAAECPMGAGTRFNLLAVYVQRERYADARRLVEELAPVGRPPIDLDRRYQGPLLYYAGVALLHTGDAQRAETLFEQSLERGMPRCAVLARLVEAAEAEGHAEEAAIRRQRLAACAPVRGL
jgi:hypothetical protein